MLENLTMSYCYNVLSSDAWMQPLNSDIFVGGFSHQVDRGTAIILIAPGEAV